jgi:large subunit ribosomal protein L25
MKSVPLKAFPRSVQKRRGPLKQLRSNGRVPAVIYGRQVAPQSLEISAREIGDLMHTHVSENLLVDLAIEKDARAKRLALVQEIQRHPINGAVVHVDFHEVAEDEKVIVHVPIETVGEAAGVKNNGGVLEHVLFKLKVRCLPKDLPEQITVDVTSLEIGKTIHIGEITAPQGVEILGSKNIPVVSVAAPRAEEEAAPTAEAKGASEVEMTKEKKEEGGEGEAKGAEKAPAKAEAKGAEKKAEAKPEAKAEKKK